MTAWATSANIPVDSIKLEEQGTTAHIPSCTTPGLLHTITGIGGTDMSCSCPFFEEHSTCKHVVLLWKHLMDVPPVEMLWLMGTHAGSTACNADLLLLAETMRGKAEAMAKQQGQGPSEQHQAPGTGQHDDCIVATPTPTAPACTQSEADISGQEVRQQQTQVPLPGLFPVPVPEPTWLLLPTGNSCGVSSLEPLTAGEWLGRVEQVVSRLRAATQGDEGMSLAALRRKAGHFVVMSLVELSQALHSPLPPAPRAPTHTSPDQGLRSDNDNPRTNVLSNIPPDAPGTSVNNSAVTCQPAMVHEETHSDSQVSALDARSTPMTDAITGIVSQSQHQDRQSDTRSNIHAAISPVVSLDMPVLQPSSQSESQTQAQQGGGNDSCKEPAETCSVPHIKQLVSTHDGIVTAQRHIPGRPKKRSIREALETSQETQQFPVQAPPASIDKLVKTRKTQDSKPSARIQRLTPDGAARMAALDDILSGIKPASAAGEAAAMAAMGHASNTRVGINTGNATPVTGAPPVHANTSNQVQMHQNPAQQQTESATTATRDLCLDDRVQSARPEQDTYTGTTMTNTITSGQHAGNVSSQLQHVAVPPPCTTGNDMGNTTQQSSHVSGLLDMLAVTNELPMLAVPPPDATDLVLSESDLMPIEASTHFDGNYVPWPFAAPSAGFQAACHHAFCCNSNSYYNPGITTQVHASTAQQNRGYGMQGLTLTRAPGPQANYPNGRGSRALSDTGAIHQNTSAGVNQNRSDYRTSANQQRQTYTTYNSHQPATRMDLLWIHWRRYD